MAFQGIVFELGACVMTDVDEDGVLMAQVDGLGESPRTAPYELHHPFGFASRPLDPETAKDGTLIEGSACNLLVGRDGTEGHAWLAADPRFVQNFPELKKGSSAQYCARRSFDLHDGEDGTKTIYVEVENSAHLVTIGRDGNGDPIIEVVHSEGMALTMFKGKVILKNAAGNAYVEVNDSEIVANGNLRVVGDVKTRTFISLEKHTHISPFGPTSPPVPTP